MLVKLRENVYLGDKDAYKTIDDLKEAKINSVIIVADDLAAPDFGPNADVKVWKVGIRGDRMNPPHVKDLACHCPKYMTGNGETVLIQSVTGLQRGAYIACRMLCELEQKTIYEIMQELKGLVPEFDVNKSYF